MTRYLWPEFIPHNCCAILPNSVKKHITPLKKNAINPDKKKKSTCNKNQPNIYFT